MTSASWKNFYVSEYDQEMHLGKYRNAQLPPNIFALDERGNTLAACGCIEAKVLDTGHYCYTKRTHTNMDHAILALNRLKETIEELRECSDPHARVAISYSVKAKMRDVQYAVELIDKRID